MNDVVWLDIAPNPNWQGPWPDPAAKRCHDGSGYLEVGCPCGASMHIHSSQLAGLPPGDGIVSPCPDCDRLLGMSVRAVREAIDLMWADA